MNVRLRAEDIKGSPYEIEVLPGEISSALSHTTITTEQLSLIEAGETYLFTIQLVDIFGNKLIKGN